MLQPAAIQSSSSSLRLKFYFPNLHGSSDLDLGRCRPLCLCRLSLLSSSIVFIIIDYASHEIWSISR
ncbi:hypothetical protein K2173_026764 [Erythroxylum novogranatense]|uniref:Uncharacterized protein n=1 Tax=Erythroxylum novogranatense TaxID=1862640 RepID=A0AAV8TXD5_9ROSI|nr:hypothetical protein K2173_026764 [Erythroxylum novogranatense]